MASILTGDDVLDGKAGQRVDGLRIQVLDADGNNIGETNADLASPGTVDWNSDNKISRFWQSVLFAPAEAAELQPNVNRLRPYWTLPGYNAQWPLGTFIYMGGKEVEQDGGTWMKCKPMPDRSHQMDQKLLEPLSIPVGGSLVDALTTLATLQGINDVDIATSGAVNGAAPLAFAAGDKTGLQIAEKITNLLGFLPVYFDALGTMRSRPVPNPADEAEQRSYWPGQNSTVLINTVTTDASVTDRPNVFIARNTAPGGSGLISGTYFTPSSDPNSIGNIGYPIPQFVNLDGLADNDQAAVAAAALAQRAVAAQQVQSVTFDSKPDPRHDAYTIVNWRGTNMLEKAWSLQLRAGAAHRHTLTPTFV